MDIKFCKTMMMPQATIRNPQVHIHDKLVQGGRSGRSCGADAVGGVVIRKVEQRCPLHCLGFSRQQAV